MTHRPRRRWRCATEKSQPSEAHRTSARAPVPPPTRVLLDPGADAAVGVAPATDLAARLTVERDGAGQPTGWLTGDNRAISDLFDLLPRPAFAAKVAGTRAFFRALNAVGLTGVI